MLWTALRRLRDEEDGFTLIELMVVVMILAILIVMGLPTFLGVKSRFQDRAAQTDIRNAVLAARILYTDNATFTSANETPGTGLVSIVPNMCYVAGGTVSDAGGTVPCVSGSGGGSISVASSITQFSAARLSSSTSCFVILDGVTGTRYGKTTTPTQCTATWAAANAAATTPAAAGW